MSAPPTLNSILGQDAGVRTIRAALASGRLHHAWIFAGPVGVGKRTTAEAFAGILLDPTAQPNFAGEIESDPGSRVQQLIGAGTHPDLHIITKELAAVSEFSHLRDRKQLNIPIDLLRERMLGGTVVGKSLEPVVNKTPSMGHNKVFIIDEADLLDSSGQNVLLKTLEEPPGGTFIFLITTAEDRLLPTIRSRCQRVGFGALDDKAMQAWIKRAKLPVDGAELAWTLAFAAGSPGRALLAHQTGLYRWAQELEPMLADTERGRYRPDLGAAMAKLVDEWAAEWVKARGNASKEAANHAGAKHLFSMLAERARARLRAEAGTNPDGVERALRTIDRIHDTETQLRSNVQLGLAMEGLAAELARA